jgi:hypothetical protein
MSQERFSFLVSLSIENNVAQNVHISEFVKFFVDMKARKVNFK